MASGKRGVHADCGVICCTVPDRRVTGVVGVKIIVDAVRIVVAVASAVIGVVIV